MSPPPIITTETGQATLEQRVERVGEELGQAFAAVIAAVPGGPHGTVELARRLDIDKVLSSRILKAARSRTPMAVAHLMPGPDPLRRVLRGAAGQRVPGELIERAERAVRRFEQLIRSEAGDRSGLDTIIAAWLPSARAEFEVRRKQAAFKAMSQIKGVMAQTNLSAVVVAPSHDNPARLDVIWVFGLLGLHRLRPGASVKLATRRIASPDGPRHPRTLEDHPVADLSGLLLNRFCSRPLPAFDVVESGDVVHYTLAGDGFGPRSAVDFVLAESNRAEIPRSVPAGSGRRAYFFAEVSTPSRRLQYDVLVHDDVYPGAEPELILYDTAFEGVANVNDRGRDIDRLDMGESIQLLGRGSSRWPSPEVPNYADLLGEVFARLGWSPDSFRGYRSRIDYPIYGTQVTMTFVPPEA